MTLGSDSKVFYDQLGSALRSVAQDRRAYIETVDGVIIKNVKKAVSLLDVGSGDGVRAADLACRLGTTNLVMLDSSEKMVELSSRFGDSRLISIEDFHATSCFDVVTCLWNVFGHVEHKKIALENMAASLQRGGFLFLDVNNRYNAVEYGVCNALRNMWEDLCGKQTGYFINKFGNRVYLHNCWELDRIIPQAGLEIVSKHYINYRTGKFCSPFGGQILYVLKLV